MNRILSSSCLLLLLAMQVNAADITGLRINQSPDKLRVVFDVNAGVNYEVLIFEEPHRVVIDLKSSTGAASFEKDRQGLDFADTALTAIRSAVRNDIDFRVVLDLREAMRPKDFTLPPAGPYGHRLVIDLTRLAADTMEVPTPSATGAEVGSDVLRDAVVAIDAGHGGEDPGTLGIGKAPEKVVVLSIAKRLHRLINAMPGFQSRLVRTGDYYIALRRRIEIARDLPADVFISIHADAAANKSARGVSIYTLSERGASSEEAHRLANIENNSDLIGGVSDIDLRVQEETLRQVLLDMSMDANRLRSIELSRSVVEEMGKVANLRPRPLGEAAFVVLKSPDVPSILVETGYLTNRQDYRRLASEAHQEELAQAMQRGIVRFIRDNPPPGTRIAQDRNL